MPAEGTALEGHLREAIQRRYRESHAERFGISEDEFQEHLASVVARYGADFHETEKLELIASLHVEELILARACSAGNDLAWDAFLGRFRNEIRSMACQIARDDETGRELADGLYAELYGLPNREGTRVSKLHYYMGRGSLKGWLRTVLAQKHVDRCRSLAKVVSLEGQLEEGASFAAQEETAARAEDNRVAETMEELLAGLNSDDRFLLASYYLDRRTLANIGRQLGVHESTISRKLERLTGALRKSLRERLQEKGLDRRQCEELLEELDVRDLKRAKKT